MGEGREGSGIGRGKTGDRKKCLALLPRRQTGGERVWEVRVWEEEGRDGKSRREGRVWKKGEREGSGIGRGKGGPRRRTGYSPKWCVNRGVERGREPQRGGKILVVILTWMLPPVENNLA